MTNTNTLIEGLVRLVLAQRDPSCTDSQVEAFLRSGRVRELCHLVESTILQA